MLLDQIRRIRATSKSRITELEAKVSELEAVLSPEVQAELDAFEAELKSAEPVEVKAPEPDELIHVPV